MNIRIIWGEEGVAANLRLGLLLAGLEIMPGEVTSDSQ